MSWGTIIILAVIATLTISSIYNDSNYIWRIVLILGEILIIGLLGEKVWDTFSISHLTIIAIIITVASWIFLGYKNGEIVGRLFVIVMIFMLIFTVSKEYIPIIDDTKNTIDKEDALVDSTKINTENKQEEIIQNSGSVIKNGNQTVLLSADEIRETQEPMQIDGFKIYYQNQFSDVYWYGGDGKALPSNGCSITSMAIILKNFGINESPKTIVEYVNSLPDNYHKSSGGARYEMFEELAEYYGLQATCISQLPGNNVSQMKKCLEQNGMVISLQDVGEFTNNGHYIVVCDLNKKEDTVVVLDPNLNNMEKERKRDFKYSVEEVAETCDMWWLFYPKDAIVA